MPGTIPTVVPYAPKKIKRDTEFTFTIACKPNSNPLQNHTFVFVGFKNDEGNYELLGSWGKLTNHEKYNFNDFLLSETDAYIRNEPTFYKNDKETPFEMDVEYISYGMTYEQLIGFYQYLKQLESSSSNPELTNSKKEKVKIHYQAFIPNPITPQTGDTIEFVWDYTMRLKEGETAAISEEDAASHFRVGRINTCRDEACVLAKQALQTDDLGVGVPKNFMKQLPLKAKISGGMILNNPHPFLALPLPPKSFPDMDKSSMKIVEQLYKRMNRMILIAQENPITYEKFNKYKELYNQITRDQKADLIVIKEIMSSFLSSNKALISTHRGFHFWGQKTASEKMFDNILKTDPKPSLK
ncbi:hypothetical protein ACFORL_08295 [Legionella dresdenensis]|uniref:Uncharacterized protein n=1 Tax=Legionella dresdenensis TaxID=450200 RepID=A0ABV8CG48_9GAMM